MPLQEIEWLTKSFPDLKVSIKKFDKYQHKNIPFEQEVVLIQTGHQPETLNQLEMFRKTMTILLTHLKEKEKIKPVHNIS